MVVGYHVTYDGHPDAYPLHVVGRSCRTATVHAFRANYLQQAPRVDGVRQRQHHRRSEPVLRGCRAAAGKTAAEAEKALIEEFEKLKREPVSANELQRAKNQWARDYIISRETIQEKAMHLAHAAVIHNDIGTADGEFEIFMNVTTADIQRVAKTYFNDANRVVLHILPREGAMREAAGCERRFLCFGIWDVVGHFPKPFRAESAWPVERMPRPLPAREVTFPPHDIRTLSNGMQVVTVLHHEQPAVTMRLLVRAGGANDPDKKRGVSLLVTNLLDQGTTTRSSQQVADQIDSIGGVLGTGSGDDFTSVSAIVMKDSFDLAMDLVADIARNPAFAPGGIERQKEQITSTQQVNANDPDYIASAVFDRLVYGFHPYGLPGSGTPETLASITRDDLRQFHRPALRSQQHGARHRRRHHAEGGGGGRRAAFGSWPRGEPPPGAVPFPRADAPRRHRRQAGCGADGDTVGQLAIPRKHQDYLKWIWRSKCLAGKGRTGCTVCCDRSGA